MVFELELLGKAGERFFDLAVLQLRQNRQYNSFRSRLWNPSLSYRCVFLHFVLPMILASHYFRSALAALIRPSRVSRLYLYGIGRTELCRYLGGWAKSRAFFNSSLGCPRGTVMSRMGRARSKLRPLLSEKG
jgi:hypothetical protein